ncbi:porin [Skermanella pratensis]|uniref:porin n=1 Tax=Skermanella pratensis TaxID=2233999 RepID=UPI0013012E56|nr:porin [Skermanella pratensis]
MRNILLATTALAAVAGFASAANAQIKVTLGGYTEFFAATFDEDAVNNSSERDFQIETEILIRADGKADNGLLYGAKIELQNTGISGTNPPNSNGITTDEASVYLGGSWGRIELGDFDGASDTLVIVAPIYGVGQIDGDYSDFITGQPNGGYYAFDSSDATKVMYLTPRVAGFQGGVSYTPQNGNEGQSVVTAKQITNYKDLVEFGVNYTGDFSGVGVALAFTGSTAAGNSNAGVQGAQDYTALYAGGQVKYAGFAFGGGYADNDKANMTTGNALTRANIDSFGDQSVWHVGLGYTTGPIAISGTYMENDGVRGTNWSEYKAYGVGGVYTVAPGMLLQSDVMFIDDETRLLTAGKNSAKTSNEGFVWLISTRLNF